MILVKIIMMKLFIKYSYTLLLFFIYLKTQTMPNNDKAPVTPGVAVEQSIISTALSDGFSQEENNTKVSKMTNIKLYY